MPTLNPPNPAVIGQIALKLSRLSAEEVSGVLEIVDTLSPAESSRQTAADIIALGKRRAALLRDVARDQVAARFTQLAEEIRRAAVANGTAIDGDWTGD